MQKRNNRPAGLYLIQFQDIAADEYTKTRQKAKGHHSTANRSKAKRSQHNLPGPEKRYAEKDFARANIQRGGKSDPTFSTAKNKQQTALLRSR
jgi:hypothetical protein